MDLNPTFSIYRFLNSLPLLFLALDLNLSNNVNLVYATSSPEHMILGTQLLSAGQLADALSHFHAAIEGDDNNYMAYYQRAAVYLALGKSKSALPDLEKVSQIKPDFIAARLQTANIFMKQGRLNEAHIEYENILLKEPNHEEAIANLATIEPLKQAIVDAEQAVSDYQYEDAIHILSGAIELCPMDPILRELRAEVYIHTGELYKAIHDLRPTTKLRNDNTYGHLRISTLFYNLGEDEESLNEIRECLKLDQDHKECHDHYKKVKKLNKFFKDASLHLSNENYDAALMKLTAAEKLETEVDPYIHRIQDLRCHSYTKKQDIHTAIESCNIVLERDAENIDAIINRAEIYILDDRFEEAVEEYQKAVSLDEESRVLKDGLQKAQRLLKQSQQRDYYKILGLKRTAKKKEILRAYRKLAGEWHPDNFPQEEKDRAEQKFMDIAAAKEVLTDPDMREKFDNGEDPLDPESQAYQNRGQHFHGFQHGFPFGGQQGFNFKFHFN